MKEIAMTEKSQSAHASFAPMEISEGITIEATRDIKDGSYAVEIDVKQGEKSLGRLSVNESQGKFYVNVNTSDLKRNTRRELAETLAGILLNLIPEEKEAE